MKPILLFALTVLAGGCSARPDDAPLVPSTAVGRLSPIDAGVVDAAVPDAGLTERLDLTLVRDRPHRIERLDLTVTLLSAAWVRVADPRRGWAHANRAVIRFERPGEAPFEMTFGPRRDTYELFGYTFSVFGGTVLTVFPPGVATDP